MPFFDGPSHTAAPAVWLVDARIATSFATQIPANAGLVAMLAVAITCVLARTSIPNTHRQLEGSLVGVFELSLQLGAHVALRLSDRTER